MMLKNEIIQRVKRKALENDKFGGCSQSVLGSLQEEFGIGNKESFKSATVLSGGLAKRGETCGALIGALLALGLVVGRERIEDTERYAKAMEPAGKIIDRFKEELSKQFGFKEGLKSSLCEEIQEKIYGRSFKLTTEEGYQAFLDAGGHSDDGCPKVCAIAAQVAAEEILIIREAGDLSDLAKKR